MAAEARATENNGMTNLGHALLLTCRTRMVSQTPAMAMNAAAAQKGMESDRYGLSAMRVLMPTAVKKAAAASSRSPITCLTSSLAGPVRGILSISAGLIERI